MPVKKKKVKLRKEHKSKTGGLSEKGRKKINRETGSKLKRPVTKKTGLTKTERARKNSFCARMGGMEGPMKKPNGDPTRKALALRKWRCPKK
tara:strand:+ start:651 stop:926 length:276 start_codon:yes stop_codon:yes gene_type:complete